MSELVRDSYVKPNVSAMDSVIAKPSLHPSARKDPSPDGLCSRLDSITSASFFAALSALELHLAIVINQRSLPKDKLSQTLSRSLPGLQQLFVQQLCELRSCRTECGTELCL